MDEDGSFNCRVALNHYKAGMEGVDKEKINKIILDNTIGSRFYKNEQKRNIQVQERIQKMKLKLNSFSSIEQQIALKKADQIIHGIEKDRNLSRSIIHIDMDAFYASVEERDRPELKTKPMAVGGMSMLSTSNYIARKFGVRAAMPGFIALKLCPELIIVPLNFSKYKCISKEIQEIYAEYDPNYMATSLDEAYIDVTEYLQRRVLMSDLERTYKYNSDILNDLNESKLHCHSQTRTFGFSAEEVAEEIRFRIQQKTKLTASAGIAPNLMLAKIGSDLNKPNGQALIPFTKKEIMNFMMTLPLRKVGGIGKVTEQVLTALGILNCGDLIKCRATLVFLFSSVSASFFLQAGLGCSSNKIFCDTARKSISVERTFDSVSDENELILKLEELCQALSKDVENHEVEGKTVTLKTKSVDFELHTHSKSLPMCLSKADDIFVVAKDLLKKEIMDLNHLSLRLIGIGLSKLQPLSQNKQPTLEKFFLKQEEEPLKSANCINGQCSSTNITAEEFPKSIHTTSPNKRSDDSSLNVIAVEDDINVTENPNNNKKEALLSSTALVCPICSLSNFDDLFQLNIHLDECLSLELCSEGNVKKKMSNTNNTNKAVPNTSFPAMLELADTVPDFICPVCLVHFDAHETNLLAFNNHLDSCLNRQAIKRILKNEKTLNKNLNEIKVPKQSKRRKIVNAALHFNTIDKYFS